MLQALPRSHGSAAELSPFELLKRDTIRVEPLLRDTIVGKVTIASLKRRFMELPAHLRDQ